MSRNHRRHTSCSAVPTRYRLLLLAFIVLLAVGGKICKNSSEIEEARREEASKRYTTPFGDLLKVKSDISIPETMVSYTGMDISFNPERHIPNWVAWELTADETRGEVKRSNKFMPDSNVPGTALPDDYRNSGYDRGHMAPAGDMKWDRDAMNETFYMTNICPQIKALNTGAWGKLEEKCRTWARADSAIYIVCGPVMTDSMPMTIGVGEVAVPKRFFKVILAPYADKPRGIGFIMPNERVEGGMQTCATSIDEVERITGLDFFSELPDSVENMVESQNNFNLWSRIR